MNELDETKKVSVNPVYGYGWRKGNELIAVPAAFNFNCIKIILDEIEADAKLMYGQVEESGHPCDGLWAISSLRTREIDRNSYNVVFTKQEPILNEAGLPIVEKKI